MAAALALGAAGCTPIEKAADSGEAQGKMIVIKQGTVHNFGDARIGLGRIHKGDQGLVAEMDILEPGEPPTERHVSANIGTKFPAGSRTLAVDKLVGGGSGEVHLRELESPGK